jgi:hypothetical protein
MNGAMKVCQHCQKEIPPDLFIGRQAQCPFCSADLHCCQNCLFHERSAYNDCREGQAERVLDKNRSNFCDFFIFRDSKENSGAPAANPEDKLEALFK